MFFKNILFELSIFAQKQTFMDLLRLKPLLKERGITGVRFSKDLGFNTNTASNLINNKSFPKGKDLLRISEYLNVDIRDLFNPTKPTTQKTPKEVLRAAINNLEVVYTEIDK